VLKKPSHHFILELKVVWLDTLISTVHTLLFA
jgi:hypothetical protein